MIRKSESVHHRSKNPRENSNIFSKLFFYWTLPLFLKARIRNLTSDDLYQPLDGQKSNKLGKKIDSIWSSEVKRNGKNASLIKSIWKIFKWKIILYGIILFVQELIFRFLQPIFLGGLISYFNNVIGNNVIELYLYGSAVIILSVINVFNQHPFTLALFNLGMKIRLSISNLIYQKALRLSDRSLKTISPAQVINLLSENVSKLDWSILYLHYLWVAPLQLVVISIFIYIKIGYLALIGIIVMIAMIPIQSKLSREMSISNLKIDLKSDERINLTKEIIDGIEVIKLYASEKAFRTKLENTREQEIEAMRKGAHLYGIVNSLPMFATRFAVFISLIAYVFFDQILSAEKAFVIISYFNILNFSLSMSLSQAYVRWAESRAVLQRIRSYLITDEVETYDTGNDHNSESYIIVKNVTAKYNPTSTNKVLDDISFHVKAGKLVVVKGKFGSGKSSLLKAILGELSLESGEIKKSGKISYGSQEPWLFNGTIRQNIVFCEEYDKERYDEVVRVCDLEKDFNEFSIYRDKTIIMKDGKPLSGGQKARVILARAIYRKADIYLLDEPLSAVDAKVAAHIYNECILKFLSKKIVILATHQIHLLKCVDFIIEIENGNSKIVEPIENENIENNVVYDDKDDILNHHVSDIEDIKANSINQEHQLKPLITETSVKGAKSFDLSVYLKYLLAGKGYYGMSLVLAFTFGAQLLATACDGYILSWVNSIDNLVTTSNYSQCIEKGSMWNRIEQLFIDPLVDDHNLMYPFDLFINHNLSYILIYTMLISATIFISIIRGIVFFENSLQISWKLHNAMINGVIRSRMKFINDNRSGDILYRFSKDIKDVDDRVPKEFIDVMQICLNFIFIAMNITILKPILLIPSIIIIILFYILRIYYLNVSKCLKQMDIESREPINSQLNETLQGLYTIRAMNAEKVLIKKFESNLDSHSSVYYMFLATRSAFEFSIDLLCVLYISCIIVVFWIQSIDNVDAGDIGLSITQVMTIIGVITYGIRQSAQLKTTMTAVQRCLEYENIVNEGEFEIGYHNQLNKKWPENGRIEFHDYSLYYTSDLKSPNLKSISNLEFLPGEKIGIVGRTGAGKSSLINALCRFAFNKGNILIDMIDIHSIGLHDLRKKITILPQTPIIFTDTIRFNLDPLSEYSDKELWHVLKLAKLMETVQNYPNNLYNQISPNDFSIGQKQLLCLARALLRNNRILVLDEITANIDYETDRMIQEAIKSTSNNTTVLTIAHRLHTIIDCDRVLVMGNGEVRNFDSPINLLNDRNSNEFKTLAKETKDFDNLFRLAVEYNNVNIKKRNERRGSYSG